MGRKARRRGLRMSQDTASSVVPTTAPQASNNPARAGVPPSSNMAASLRSHCVRSQCTYSGCGRSAEFLQLRAAQPSLPPDRRPAAFAARPRRPRAVPRPTGALARSRIPSAPGRDRPRPHGEPWCYCSVTLRGAQAREWQRTATGAFSFGVAPTTPVCTPPCAIRRPTSIAFAAAAGNGHRTWHPPRYCTPKNLQFQVFN